MPELGLNGNVSLADYADNIIQTFGSPIAADSVGNLVYMTVGAGRIKVLSDATSRMKSFLKIGEPAVTPGVHMEAITGGFGSGKSHIGYMLKHNALTTGQELLVSHVQITGKQTFEGILASLLESMRIAGVPSVKSSGIELSAYQQIWNWCGRSTPSVTNVAVQACGNLNVAAGRDFALAVLGASQANPTGTGLQQFIESWIVRAEPRIAMKVFEMVLRVFNTLQSKRCVFIIDEFEAVLAAAEADPVSNKPRATAELRMLFQSLQDLHDDLSGRELSLPRTFIALLATSEAMELAGNALPSLMMTGQRIRRVAPLPELDDTDIAALVYRYLGLYQLARSSYASPTHEQVLKACQDVSEQVKMTRHHVRAIHAAVRARVEAMLESR